PAVLRTQRGRRHRHAAASRGPQPARPALRHPEPHGRCGRPRAAQATGRSLADRGRNAPGAAALQPHRRMTDPLYEKFSVAVAGRYTLIRELGQGGMGAVYLGSDVKLGREVAIKVLPPSMRAYLGSERFQREVQLAAKLSHPHIVPLFEADEIDGFLYYVMGYVEGESLAQRIEREGPLALEE